MKKTFIAFAAAMTMLTGSALYAADSFTDVPKDHWAYEAIEDLASRGIMLGYTDGSFRGDKPVSRNTMAMLVAKMLANVEQFIKDGNLGITKEDIKILESLSMEFKEELAALGTTVDTFRTDLDGIKNETQGLKSEVSDLKKLTEEERKVKIGGEYRAAALDYKNGGDKTVAEFDLDFSVKFDDKNSAYVYWTTYFDELGNKLGGAVEGSSEICEAYITLDDLLAGRMRFGRQYLTHGHALVLNDYVDSLQYKTSIGDLEATLNVIYDTHYFDVKSDFDHQIWNLNFDYTIEKSKYYVGYYAKTFKDDGFINAVKVRDMDSTVIEAGFSGIADEKMGLSYDAAVVMSDVDGKRLIGPDWKEAEGKGMLQHYALNWKNNTGRIKVKASYLSADEDYHGTMVLKHNGADYDVTETPFDDIVRAYPNALGVKAVGTQKGNRLQFANTQDIKIQIQAESKDKRHNVRLAYDILEDAESNALPDYMKGTPGVTNINILGVGKTKLDSDVLTLEYRYKFADYARIKLGYTVSDNGSSLDKNGAKVEDDHLFWTEVYGRF